MSWHRVRFTGRHVATRRSANRRRRQRRRERRQAARRRADPGPRADAGAPFATQLLARLGADVVKVEHPATATSGGVAAGDGRSRRAAVGATFLRNNLDKRSIGIDLKDAGGASLVLRLGPRFDVSPRTSRPGRWPPARPRLRRHRRRAPAGDLPVGVGLREHGPSPYDSWPAFAPIVEAMSGIYEFKRRGDEPPLVAPVGALGDIGSALFAVIGVLAALRHRDRTGEGQHVDIAMLDAMVAMTDIVTNFWSMGCAHRGGAADHGRLPRRATAGSSSRSAASPSSPRWPSSSAEPSGSTDPRFADRQGWVDHLDDVIRPGDRGVGRRQDQAGGVPGDVRRRHRRRALLPRRRGRRRPARAARHMLVEMPRTDGVAEPCSSPATR